jgi:hypothetical protein
VIFGCLDRFQYRDWSLNLCELTQSDFSFLISKQKPTTAELVSLGNTLPVDLTAAQFS